MTDWPSLKAAEREPVTDPAELAGFDSAEVVEGYCDGLAGDAEPGGNRSKAYWHGWRNGANDRAGKSDMSQRALIRNRRKIARLRDG